MGFAEPGLVLEVVGIGVTVVFGGPIVIVVEEGCITDGVTPIVEVAGFIVVLDGLQKPSKLDQFGYNDGVAVDRYSAHVKTALFKKSGW